MTSLVQRDKDIARRKGMVAGAATAGTIALLAVSPWLGVIGLIPAAYFVKDWFTFRAKRGMRF
jgi:hypothetical protein